MITFQGHVANKFIPHNNIFNHSLTNCFKKKLFYREENQVFGTYLTINNVEQEDIGLYMCKISKPGRTREFKVFIREKGIFFYTYLLAGHLLFFACSLI